MGGHITAGQRGAGELWPIQKYTWYMLQGSPPGCGLYLKSRGCRELKKGKHHHN